METSIKRLSSGGFWCSSLESYFERLPILWQQVEEIQSRNEEPQQISAETIRSIIAKSREAANCYTQFQYEYALNPTFSEQAPIRTSYKSPFSIKAMKNFNPYNTNTTGIIMESINRAACLVFRKKQAIFVESLSKLAKLQSNWMAYFISYWKNHQSSLQFIKKLYTQVEIYGMDLSLLYFQADIYLLLAFRATEGCEEVSIYDIQPSRFFLENKKTKIFLFEKNKTLHNFCESFQESPEDQCAEFDRCLQNYIDKKEKEAKKPAAGNVIELDEDTLNWVLKWVEE